MTIKQNGRCVFLIKFNLQEHVRLKELVRPEGESWTEALKRLIEKGLWPKIPKPDQEW